MSDIDKAVRTQLANIQVATGKTLDELYQLVGQRGVAKHGEILKMLKAELGLGHGDANAIALQYLKRPTAQGAGGGGQQASGGDILDEIYSGAKAPLRPIHEAVMTEIRKLGEFEIAPKKGYVSLRRKKQFAMVGVATKGRVEVGLNMKDLDATGRLIAMPAGGMCQYKVFLSQASEADSELMAWVRRAFEGAG